MSLTFPHRNFFPSLALLGLLASFAWAAPSPPAHLALTAVPLAGQVGLTWNAAAGATSYSVKRATSANGTFNALGAPTATNFTDTTAAAGTRYFYRVTAMDGTGEGAASLTISSTPAVVVDNAASSGVTITGAWSASTAVAGFYGSNYLLDGNTGGAGGKSVRFTPALPLAGRYDVFIRWASDASRATNARVEVNSTAGTTFLKVNQQANGGTWVKLGAFDFTAGSVGNVLLRNNGANGWVVADAVQMVLNEQPLPGYTQLTFVDEFDGTAYDATTWSVYDGRPNNTVSGGQLHLGTTMNGTDWISGGLYTAKFMQRFGYYETVMEIGRDDGLNNAFWLNTPSSHSNNLDVLEIDIAEAHFHNENHMNVHDWRPVHVGSGATQSVPDIFPGYHTVGLEWAADGVLRWYWDGALARTMTASQLSVYEGMTPMQVMFSTKVIPFAGTPGPLLNGSSMDIASVRVWLKPGWGGGLDGNWGTPTNWGPDGVPGAGDAAIFNRSTPRTTVGIASDKSVKELYFSTPECPAMTLAAGSFKFLLGALASGSGVGGIVVNGDVTTAQTINTAIQAQNDLTFANYSTAPTATLNVNGPLTSSVTGRQLNLAGNGRVSMGSNISGSFGNVVKVNGGAAWLTGVNAFTGSADIQNGRLVVTDTASLGTTAGGTTVASGATLALAGGVNFTRAEVIRLAGNGESGTSGALDLEDNSLVNFSGLLVMDAATKIGSGAGSGTLTLASDLDTTAAAFALSFDGSGTTVMNGDITGAGALTKTGTGTLRLNGLAAHTGTTTVAQGTLITNLASLPEAVVNYGTVIYEETVDRTATNNWGGTGTYIKRGTGTLTVAAAMSTIGMLEVQTGTLKLAAGERFSSSLDLTVTTDGIFDLNSFSETLDTVVLAGGSIVNSTGTSLQYLAGTSYDVRSGTVSARLGGTSGLTKTTSGTVTLSGANSFTGGTSVQAGILELSGSLASTVSVDGGTLALGATTGIRTVSASLAVNTAGSLRYRINGTTAGSQYDQLRITNVTSTVALAGSLDLIAAPALPVGSTFRILDNSGNSAAITGSFAGLPEGTEFYQDDQWWRISYLGGTGNDVVITRLNPTPTQTWQTTHFGINASNPAIASDLADPDNDGTSNLLERATAMLPNTSDTVPAALNKAATNLDFVYRKNKSATDLTFAVEWSETLTGSWTTTGLSSPIILSDNGTTQQIKVSLPAGIKKRFMRLRITRP